MTIPRLKTPITAVDLAHVLNALHIPLCLALRDPVRLVVASDLEATTLAKVRPERAIMGAAGLGTVCPNHRAA